MKWMRIGMLCGLVGCMSALAQAQWGTYGSPDPIPLGQYAPQNAYQPAVINRTAYVNAVDPTGPTLSATPGPANLPLPPAPEGNVQPADSAAVAGMLNEPSPAVGPVPGCGMMPPGGYMQNAAACDNACCCNACCDHWYASVDALYMTRSGPRTTYTSAEPPNNPVNQGHFDDVNWTWGRKAPSATASAAVASGPPRSPIGTSRKGTATADRAFPAPTSRP